MDRLVIGSTSRGAGKTSLIVGIGRALGGNLCYRKPFGDRLVYRRKVARDYDAALVSTVFGLQGNPEEATIGFEHAKLKYMYDEEGRRKRLGEMVPQSPPPGAALLVEAGADLFCGSSVHLDALSLARYLDARLVLVVAGGENAMLDEIAFVQRQVQLGGVKFAGVIVNKLRDVAAFRDMFLPKPDALGVPVLGLVALRDELTHPSIAYVVERLFGKVLTGDAALGRLVKNVFIGAMSADAALRSPLFQHPGKLIITSGDRTDMVLASLEGDTACVVLTNNVVPPANILSRAAERGIPLVLVSQDTYQVAAQIDKLEPLITAGESAKLESLAQLVRGHVQLDRLLPNTKLVPAPAGTP